ncbi:TetR/AcrR family transcriptional regulator [Microbacterium pumilum]|uniref:TetR/AcrR family transcriptional regulator n=1 Tax=Microbacterium pumilum TaxID=344165 RepID=A0ABN2S6B2_9MICO
MNEHRAGPVRSAAAREAILAATAKMFQAQGYEQLTIEGIAKEAGVGKQTIYRWWKSRGALIAECLTDGRLFPVDLVAKNSGDVIADIEEWVSGVIGILVSHNGESLLRSLVAAAAEDADVGDHLTLGMGVEDRLSERMRIGIADGQLPPDAPVTELAQAIIGALVIQVLTRANEYEGPMRQLIRFILAPRFA